MVIREVSPIITLAGEDMCRIKERKELMKKFDKINISTKGKLKSGMSEMGIKINKK